MKLRVPLLYQSKNSSDCTIVSTQMVMAFYGEDIDLSQLKKELEPWFSTKERHTQGAAIYLAQHGYNVLFMHHDQNVIDEKIENSTEKDLDKLESQLKALNESNSSDFRRKKLALDIDVIKAGSKYANIIPTLKIIDNALENQNPAIIGINLKAWLTNPDRGNNHTVVVIGKENEDYIINDPSPNSKGTYTVHKDKLLLSWYMSGAYTIIAKEKY